MEVQWDYILVRSGTDHAILAKMVIIKYNKGYTICLGLWDKIPGSINNELHSVNQTDFELNNVWMNYSNLPFVTDTKMLVLFNSEEKLTWWMNWFSVMPKQAQKPLSLMNFSIFNIGGVERWEEGLQSAEDLPSRGLHILCCTFLLSLICDTKLFLFQRMTIFSHPLLST